jgi:hypothetical protein
MARKLFQPALGYVDQEKQQISDREREMLFSGDRSTRLLSRAWPVDSVRGRIIEVNGIRSF